MKRILTILFLFTICINAFAWSGGNDASASATVYVASSNESKAYPNPIKSGNELSVEITTASEMHLEVYVMDIIGNRLFENELYSNGGSVKQMLNTYELKPGIYFLHVSGDDYKDVIKLIVRK